MAQKDVKKLAALFLAAVLFAFNFAVCAEEAAKTTTVFFPPAGCVSGRFALIGWDATVGDDVACMPIPQCSGNTPYLTFNGQAFMCTGGQ